MKTSKKQFWMKSIFTLVIALCVFSVATFAGEYEKMESKPIKKVISSNFDFFILYFLSTDNVEESLLVKTWMLSTESFVEIEINSIPNNTEEATLQLKNWMLNVQAFIPDEDEPELAIENWMLDVDSFIA